MSKTRTLLRTSHTVATRTHARSGMVMATAVRMTPAAWAAQ
jgi:hypothetical protein